MVRSRPAAFAAVVAAALSVAGATQAQDYVRPACRPALAGIALRFDSPEQVRWYKRFWTGECRLLVPCVPGWPNWNDIVDRLEVRSPPAEQAAVLVKACRVGELIGLEWSRERRVRRLDTEDLRSLSVTLQSSSDPLRGLERVEVAARTKMAH